MPAFRGTSTRQEVWRLTAPWAASAASGTKQYCTIARNPGGVAVATASVPFGLPITEGALFMDWFVVNTTDDNVLSLVDLDINGIAQRVGLHTSSILVTNLTRPRMRPISANPGSNIAPFYTSLESASTTAETSVSYLATAIMPRGA